MKLFITIAALFLGFAGSSQSALTGKWKPVYFSLDTMFRADIKADTFYINPSLKEEFKNDKDPEVSEQMMKFMMEALYQKVKAAQEEYFNDGKYVETNTDNGKSKTGAYIYDQKESKLERTVGASAGKQHFVVSWKDGRLVLTGELGGVNGKKGKLEVVYEKL